MRRRFLKDGDLVPQCQDFQLNRDTRSKVNVKRQKYSQNEIDDCEFEPKVIPSFMNSP